MKREQAIEGARDFSSRHGLRVFVVFLGDGHWMYLEEGVFRQAVRERHVRERDVTAICEQGKVVLDRA